MTLSQIVKQYRTDHSLSQRQFSDACGMSAGYISMLEEGVNPRTKEPLVPSLVTIRKIARAMGMGLDDLMNIIDGNAMVSMEADDALTTSKSSEREKEFMSLFRSLSDEEQILLLRQMRGLLIGK